MSHFFKLAVVLATVCMLSACGGQSVGEKQATSINKIAVFSNLGNEFRFRNAGFLTGSEDSYRDVSAWDMDAHIGSRIVAELEKLGYKAAETVALEAPVVRDADYRKLTDAAKDAGYDTLVMVYARNERVDQPYFIPDGQGGGTMVGGYNDPIPDGYGVFSQNSMGVESGCVFSAFLVTILDLRSGERIAHNHSNTGDFMLDDTGGCANTSPRGGIRMQTGIAMPQNAERADDLSDDYVQSLEAVIKQDIANDLAYMLPRLLPKR